MKRHAFTLIELLVVIAVIAILSAVAVWSISVSRVSARDARRVADVRHMVDAIELYYAANGAYPVSSSASSGGLTCLNGVPCYGIWATAPDVPSLDAAVIQYMGQVPIDPNQGKRPMGGYLYSDHWGGGLAPSGQRFRGGVILAYVLEEFTNCILGRPLDQVSGSLYTYTECVYEFK